MDRIVIGWRHEPFSCEYSAGHGSGWLQIFRESELVLKEPVESVRAAFARARELCEGLIWQAAKGA